MQPILQPQANEEEFVISGEVISITNTNNYTLCKIAYKDYAKGITGGETKQIDVIISNYTAMQGNTKLLDLRVGSSIRVNVTRLKNMPNLPAKALSIRICK
jgi:hypothetical protein